MKIINLYLVILLSCISMSASAGKIYRFVDKSGVSTMSKSLPAYAAQQGYDILDDKSLRLIKRVYSREEFIKIQQKQAAIEQAEKEKQQMLDAQKKAQKEKLARDKNLISRYPTDAVLIKSRDSELAYRQFQIDELKSRLLNNQKKLGSLQAQAAESELNGKKISEHLATRIQSTRQEIKNNQDSIAQSIIDKDITAQKFEDDLIRLQTLLKAK